MGKARKRSDTESPKPSKPRGPSRVRQWAVCAGLMLVGSLLVSLSFAPIYLAPLAWIGLVPWFIGVDGLSSRRAAFFIAWAVGTIYFAANMVWVIGVTAPGWVALAVYLGLYWAVPAAVFYGMRWLRPLRQAQGGPFRHAQGGPPEHHPLLCVLLIAATWTAFDWVRGILLTGLAWEFLGHSQTPLSVVCQIADTTGVYGVTFWLIMVNATIYMTWRVRPMRTLYGTWLLAGGSTVFVVAYGCYRLASTVTYPGPVVMVVQSNYPQSNSGAKGADMPTIVKFHLDQTTKTLSTWPAGSVDLAAWSETMMPPFNQENLDFLSGFNDPGARDDVAKWTDDRRAVSELAAKNNMAVIAGGAWAGKYTAGPDGYYVPEKRNTAYFFDRSGLLAQRYDKIHLVPFGEFVPFKESFPWLHDQLVKFGPADMNDYALEHGSDLTVFTLDKSHADSAALRPGDSPSWRFVAPICFEDLDSRLVASMFRGDDQTKRAQFMVNLTNDGWFILNQNSDHFQAAVFRCIENRAPMARAVNTGISGFIDSTGRASGRVPVRTEGATAQQLALDPRVTFYTRHGDLFADVCALVAAVALLRRIDWTFWKRRQAMKTAALILFGVAAMGSMWGCQSDAGSKDPLSQPPPSLDPDPPPPLVATPIDPNLQARARAELVELAKSTDANLRANTLAAMIDSMGTEAQPQFLAALDDPDPTARFVATIAAGRLKLGAARDKLLALVGGGDESVKVGAIFALHRLGDHDFSHELEATAVSPITTVRADTAVVLGYLGEPSGATILTVLLSDREISVQEQAAQALWRLGSQQGLDVLSAKAISKYPDDQIFALDALAETGDDRVRGQVRGELGCWPPEVQLTAARAMGELRSDAGYTLGIKYATAADDLQRAMAAQALGAIGRPDSQTVLAKLLADRSPQVKLAAAAAIVQLGHHK